MKLNEECSASSQITCVVNYYLVKGDGKVMAR